MNDQMNLIEPNGNLAFLVAVPAIAGAIWGALEFALSAWDIINLVRDLFDSCVSWGEWGASAGLSALEIVGPGGGYGQLGKAAKASPALKGNPYSPIEVNKRQSEWRRKLNTGNNDPDSLIPD